MKALGYIEWWTGVEAEFDGTYGVDIFRASTRRSSGRYILCFEDGSSLRVPSLRVARAVALWVAHERPRRDDREDHATIAAHARYVFGRISLAAGDPCKKPNRKGGPCLPVDPNMRTTKGQDMTTEHTTTSPKHHDAKRGGYLGYDLARDKSKPLPDPETGVVRCECGHYRESSRWCPNCGRAVAAEAGS